MFAGDVRSVLLSRCRREPVSDYPEMSYWRAEKSVQSILNGSGPHSIMRCDASAWSGHIQRRMALWERNL